MTIVLEALLAYMIGLAANERSAAITASRERKLKEALEKGDALKKALASRRSVRDEFRVACNELARNWHRFGVTPQEKRVWRLLSDDLFQAEEAFLTNSVREVVPLVQLDGAGIGNGSPGPVTRSLQASYRDSVARAAGLPGN